jgi:hypothetical protein
MYEGSRRWYEVNFYFDISYMEIEIIRPYFKAWGLEDVLPIISKYLHVNSEKSPCNYKEYRRKIWNEKILKNVPVQVNLHFFGNRLTDNQERYLIESIFEYINHNIENFQKCRFKRLINKHNIFPYYLTYSTHLNHYKGFIRSNIFKCYKFILHTNKQPFLYYKNNWYNFFNGVDPIYLQCPFDIPQHSKRFKETYQELMYDKEDVYVNDNMYVYKPNLTRPQF